MRYISAFTFMLLSAAAATPPEHAALAAVHSTPIPNSPVTFRSYRAALREARAQHKPVLLLFTNPHCGPCRALESLVLADPIGSSVVAAGYVPVRLTAR